MVFNQFDESASREFSLPPTPTDLNKRFDGIFRGTSADKRNRPFLRTPCASGGGARYEKTAVITIIADGGMTARVGRRTIIALASFKCDLDFVSSFPPYRICLENVYTPVNYNVVLAKHGPFRVGRKSERRSLVYFCWLNVFVYDYTFSIELVIQTLPKLSWYTRKRFDLLIFETINNDLGEPRTQVGIFALRYYNPEYRFSWVKSWWKRIA